MNNPLKFNNTHISLSVPPVDINSVENGEKISMRLTERKDEANDKITRIDACIVDINSKRVTEWHKIKKY